ncbi:MAG: pilin [Patescibacteria group bacterium]
MKKSFLLFFISFAILFLIFGIFGKISAYSDGTAETESWNDSYCPSTGDPKATGLVPCGVSCTCTIENFFLMLARIYDFIVWYIATPLAVLALTIGGVIMMISAGNPNLFATGKKILYAAIIGLVLVFCSWLIIDFILAAIGYSMGKPWWSL